MPPTLVLQAVPRVSATRTVPSSRRAPRPVLPQESTEERAARDAAFSESALVVRLQHGDEAAFETLVRTYGPRMFVVARGYVTSHEDAEDVLQSSFLLVVRFIRRFAGASRLSTWLHRIVVNCALMRIRSRHRHPEERTSGSALENDGVAELAAHVGSSVAVELEQRETRDRLLRAVGRLPDSVRPAVCLRDLDGLSLAETSLLLRRPVTAVKASVQRGRIALRAMLTREGEFQESR